MLQTADDRRQMVIIEARLLIRECLANSLNCGGRFSVASFCDVEEWVRASSPFRPALIILSLLHRPSDEWPDLISKLNVSGKGARILILSERQDFGRIARSLNVGAHGHIPTSLSLEAAVRAIEFVIAGGVFIPAQAMMRCNHKQGGDTREDQRSLLTRRECAVVNGLRKGKSNKLIAYELKMSESTVKVHVHKILRKLSARNRTEAVIKIAELYDEQDVAELI